MTLWLIEGLPGTGKTTMAEQLCFLARKSGFAAAWYLEESIDHPVHGRKLKEGRKNGDIFVKSCLDAWRAYADNSTKTPDIQILEGSAFQSTVRFMMEEQIPGIENYYALFEEIVAPLAARLVYLRPKDAIAHTLRTSISRGEDWTGKVGSYFEKTVYSKSHGLVSTSGMHHFWADYAVLCDHLVRKSALPVKIISVEPGEWARHGAEAMDFFGLKVG